MRIAIFHELPKKSGSRKSVDIIAKLLSGDNIVDVHYVDSASSYPTKNPFHKIFFYKFVPVIWEGNNPATRLYRDTVELLKLFLLHRKIAAKIRSKKYDVLFVHGSFLTESPFILLFKNAFKIYYAHAPNYTLIFERVMGIPKGDRVRYIYEHLNRYVRKLIDKKNVRSADIILANSIYTKNKIASFYGKKSIVSYLGVDVSIYKPLKIKKKYDFLFVGSYHPVDGYNLLHQAVDLMKKKPSYKILAIEDEWIEDDQEMARLYNSAKVVLCLSHGEPFGLVAIEAMACGVPVVAVDEAGYRETVIHNKTGILINRKPEALVKALRSLLGNTKRLEQYSRSSRQEAVRRWSWRVRVRDMEKIIKGKVGL
ncbi:MAG: glycosyltransferase family 4 protein [Candidatus Levybacteria bacterium]|nr:glycosyltransferase family 4 protein [Candidatus Levybacteria bacterium]